MPTPNIKLSIPDAKFIHPHTGNLFFSDVNERRIYKFCPSTSEIIFITKLDSEFIDPQSVWVTNDEQIMYFTQSHTIRKMNLKSGVCEIICGVGISSFNGDGKAASETMISGPKNLKLFEEEGELYFYCSGNLRFRKINSSGVVETIMCFNDYPDLKNSFNIMDGYGNMEISQCKKLIYLNIGNRGCFSLFRIDTETKECTVICKKNYELEFQYFNDEIYISNIDTIYKIGSSGTESVFYKGTHEIICFRIAHKTAYLFAIPSGANHFFQGYILNTDDFTLSSPFLEYNEKKDFHELRQFFFEEYPSSFFNILKLDRDLKSGTDIICFKPLLQKVAPKLSKDIETNGQELDYEAIQYLVDYCIYHDYSDFKGVDIEVLKKVKDYFNKAYDPIFKPLVDYLKNIFAKSLKKYETSNKKQKITKENINNNPIHLSDLFNDSSTSDFSIFLDGNEWKCHKTILSKSKFFQTMLEGSFTSFSDVDENEFHMDKETNPKVAEIIIKYCYDIHPDLNELFSSEFIELIQCAELHELESLGKECVENLVLNLENFRPLAQFIAQFEDSQFPSLQQRLVQFSLENSLDLIEKTYEGNKSQLPSFIISAFKCANVEQ